MSRQPLQHRPQPKSDEFLPTTQQEMARRNWRQLDILLVSGDAYVDHPGFGIPLLARLLESKGYKVGIIDQPRWDTPDDIKRMGRPRLFCGLCAGAMDSLLCHYTSFRKKRRDDACTPGGVAGKRPNRASIVYANLAKAAFPGLPIILGGVEASLRKAAHYDFWTDALRRSILLDAKANLLVYGMGELAMIEIARRLDANEPLDGIRGTARVGVPPENAQRLPSFEEIQQDKSLLIKATLQLEAHYHNGSTPIVQQHGNQFVVIEPSAPPLTTEQMDALYSLPFTRRQHPKYDQPVPALDMLRFSVTAVRGCAGACAFCSIAQHQGRKITSRSTESLVAEITRMTKMPEWRGSISDVGGPTANLWGSTCKANYQHCHRASCLTPEICPNLVLDLNAYVNMLQKLTAIPGVKHISVASGLRHDAALREPEAARRLVANFVGGHLKLAPEHCSDKVLRLMRKPSFEKFERFLDIFQATSAQHGKEQYIIPYIISAYPGCEMSDMKTVANWFKKRGWQPQQIQCFIPTPGTLATAMFYAEKDFNGNPIHVPKTDREREDQHTVLIKKKSAQNY